MDRWKVKVRYVVFDIPVGFGGDEKKYGLGKMEVQQKEWNSGRYDDGRGRHDYHDIKKIQVVLSKRKDQDWMTRNKKIIQQEKEDRIKMEW